MDDNKNGVDDLSRDELLKLVRMQAAAIKRLEKRIEQLAGKGNDKNPTERLDESYSQKAEEKRKRIKQRKAKGKRKGRLGK